MIERANGRNTFPQIFIGSTHVGGCDELYALEEAGELDALLQQGEESAGMSAPAPSAFKVGLVQMRSGVDPQANLATALRLDRGGGAAPAPTTCSRRK